MSLDWGMDAVNIVKGLTDNVMDDICPAPSAAPAKKLKGRTPHYSMKVCDLAGNGQCLPDLCMIAVPLIFIAQLDYFDAFPVAQLPLPSAVLDPSSLSSASSMIISGDTTDTDLRHMQRKAASVTQMPEDAGDIE